MLLWIMIMAPSYLSLISRQYIWDFLEEIEAKEIVAIIESVSLNIMRAPNTISA